MNRRKDAVIRCTFKFQCPMLWEGLGRTDDEKVRHCRSCDRDVHLVSTQDEFDRYAASGHCVAVPLDHRKFPEPSATVTVISMGIPAPAGYEKPSARGMQDAPKCPGCGSAGDVIQIVYDDPGPELIEQESKGEIWLGGCVVDPAKWHCKPCEMDF